MCGTHAFARLPAADAQLLRDGETHVSWYKLFRKYDTDGTGRIDRAEMERALRDKTGLHLSKRALADEEYAWLWEVSRDDAARKDLVNPPSI